MYRRRAYDLLTRVRDEFDAGQFALRRVLSEWDHDADLVIAAQQGYVTETEIRRCADNLELTFVLRLFSEFEAILRDFWTQGMGRATEPTMTQLLDSIAARCAVHPDDLAMAHNIREFRNQIIHESLRELRFDYPRCARALGKYLSRLPVD